MPTEVAGIDGKAAVAAGSEPDKIVCTTITTCLCTRGLVALIFRRAIDSVAALMLAQVSLAVTWTWLT
jgi:hypothetical protein